MRKKRFLLAVVTILSLALAAGVISILTVSKVDGTKGWYASAADAYVYPVSPWTTPEKWKTYISHVDMMKALLIPEDVLKSMSTAGLVETCINYPLYGDYINFDSYYAGIEMTERNFNGLQELYRRKDAAKEFVRFYQSINVAALHTLHRFPSYQLSFIEFIMANTNLVDKMTSEERVALMKAVLQNTHIRESQMRASMEDVSKSLLLGRVLLEESAVFRETLSNDHAKQDFILTGDMVASNTPMLGLTASDFIKTMEGMIKMK